MVERLQCCATLSARFCVHPGGRILALSRYTAKGLEAIAQRPMDGIMLMPVDPRQFYPDPECTIPWKVGFSGRYGDPVKI